MFFDFWDRSSVSDEEERSVRMNSVVTGWNRGSRIGGVGSVTWYVRRACYITLSSRASGVSIRWVVTHRPWLAHFSRFHDISQFLTTHDDFHFL